MNEENNEALAQPKATVEPVKNKTVAPMRLDDEDSAAIQKPDFLSTTLQGKMLWFLILCMLAGLLTGLAGGYFQVFLRMAQAYCLEVSVWAHQVPFWKGFGTLLLICVGCAVIGRALVRFSPTAGGSGIQYVEAMWSNETAPSRFSVLIVKFFGGLLTLGSGMALGREGPSVQMGAAIGAFIGRVTKLSRDDLKYITVASAGTGLGVAFSAPLGGAMFVFEEVTKEIKPHLVISTLLSVLLGCALSMTILGAEPDYHVINTHFPIPGPLEIFAVILFGVFTGVMGVLYNKTVLAFIDFNAWLRHLWPEVKAAVVGVVVAAILWYAPHLSGGGDEMSQQMLNYTYPILTILLFGVVRWFFAPLSYSSGVPGGLFSPLLLMGGILGHFYAWGMNLVDFGLDPLAFCAVGMSAFFASTIRAPITGILLILEMTACWDLSLMMIGSSIVSYVTARMFNGLPIYTSLRLRIPSIKELL